MKHTTKFILAMCGLFLVLIVAILILHKTVSNSLLSTNTKENSAATQLVTVETTHGQSEDESLSNPLDEPGGSNFDFGAFKDKLSEKEEKRENEPSDAREGDKTTFAGAGENIFTENGLEVVHFDYCKDGDTIVATKGNGEAITIRLIGINTPESVAPDEYTEKTGKENNDYGKLASKHAKELFKDADILYLEYDLGTTDPYGRALAYIYFSENGNLDDMANAIMIRDGYASVMTIEPNTKYASDFQTLQNAAKELKVGLWKYDDYYENYQNY